MVVSETHYTSSDGASLFARRWDASQPAKGTVVLVHGFGEHSGRWDRVARHLSAAGYAVSALDLRGHGRSSGRRGDCRFALTMQDIDRLVEQERGLAEGLPVFLYGHSLGGLLVLSYTLDRRNRVDGVIASAPALHTALREQRLKVLVARALGKVAPSISIPAGLDDTLLSRNEDFLEDYRSDELVHDRACFGFARDSLMAMDRVLQDGSGFPAPLLIIHGAADRINYLSGSEVVAKAVGDSCTLSVYDGVFHQPHTDPETERVLSDVVAWLDRHGGQEASRAARLS